jgi:hypothetical protein
MADENKNNEQQVNEDQSNGRRTPWLISKVKNTGQSIGKEVKHSSQVQEGSPADYVQRGLARIGSTKMGKKIKSQLDKNKK